MYLIFIVLWNISHLYTQKRPINKIIVIAIIIAVVVVVAFASANSDFVCENL